ncbi:MAG: molybdopterin-dependent oxidoreductase, partial [Rhodobacteraceae bacterium]|nr:molybdopterin-dependent oxidoreductase [Paracoccaceae bacterium]
MTFQQPQIETSPHVSDEVRKTTCYMCACRCGINVHMKDGKVAYIEGNRDHPVNKGVLCAKGSAGIMQVNAPSRLRAPLKRVGERGSGEFEESTWDEALSIATGWLDPVRKNNPEKLAFFTHIARSMNIDPEAVRTTLDAYERDASKDSYRAFAQAAEPPRQELIRRLNMVP